MVGGEGGFGEFEEEDVLVGLDSLYDAVLKMGEKVGFLVAGGLNGLLVDVEKLCKKGSTP